MTTIIFRYRDKGGVYRKKAWGCTGPTKARNSPLSPRKQRHELRIQRQSGMAEAGWEPQADTPASAVPLVPTRVELGDY